MICRIKKRVFVADCSVVYAKCISFQCVSDCHVQRTGIPLLAVGAFIIKCQAVRRPSADVKQLFIKPLDTAVKMVASLITCDMIFPAVKVKSPPLCGFPPYLLCRRQMFRLQRVLQYY